MEEEREKNRMREGGRERERERLLPYMSRLFTGCYSKEKFRMQLITTLAKETKPLRSAQEKLVYFTVTHNLHSIFELCKMILFRMWSIFLLAKL